MRFSDWSSDVCSSDLTSLTAATLPEGQPHPALYDALSALLDAIAVAPSARQWAAALARYELLLLAELGFGLALDACAATGGTEDLARSEERRVGKSGSVRVDLGGRRIIKKKI